MAGGRRRSHESTSIILYFFFFFQLVSVKLRFDMVSSSQRCRLDGIVRAFTHTEYSYSSYSATEADRRQKYGCVIPYLFVVFVYVSLQLIFLMLLTSDDEIYFSI